MDHVANKEKHATMASQQKQLNFYIHNKLHVDPQFSPPCT